MPEFKIRDIIIPTVALVIICGISTGLLAGTNELTKEPIAAAEELSVQISMEAVAPDNAERFEKINIDDKTAKCYRALDKDGNVVSYAISTSAKGYGGTIKVMTGIDINGNIIGINVYDNSQETPGLGAKTSNEEFGGQFTGRSADKKFSVTKDSLKYPDDQTIDAVTGATISSRAVVGAVDHALDIYRIVVGGGGE